MFNSLKGFRTVFRTQQFSKIMHRNVSSTNTTFTVTPKSALVDDNLQVKVTGLPPFDLITLHSNLKNDKNVFAAVAHYVSDINGVVDTRVQPSVGGNYIGTEPEGLIWSMQPAPGKENYRRMIKLDVMTPHLLNISLMNKHLTIEEAIQQSPIASDTVERWYLGKDVDRIEVREGRVRGSLFIPKGQGPFLPIIDMFGSIGQIIEFRAALLASRGFAVLALPFFGYDDLPKKLEYIDLDYFEEAVSFMMKHQKVKARGVGVIGVSKGGEIAHFMAECLPDVKAVVSIGTGAILVDMPGVSKKRNLYRECGSYMNHWKETTRIKDETEVSLRNIYTPEELYEEFKKCNSKIEKSEAHFLIVNGSLDLCAHPIIAAISAEHLEKCGKNNFELLIYPGAGHLIEPPHAPLGTSSFVRTYDEKLTFMYGGEPSLHAKAQVDLWNRMQVFYKKHLTPIS